MIDVTKARAATKSDDSRANPLSRMLKQPRTNSGPPPAQAPRKAVPDKAASAQVKPEPVKASPATIGASIAIKGDITGRGDVFLSGSVEGTVDLPGNDVTVEQSGRVEGSIVSKQALVRGQVVGDIEALDKITISATGTVQGTIVAPRVVVEDGARFKGHIDMELDERSDAAPAASLSKN